MIRPRTDYQKEQEIANDELLRHIHDFTRSPETKKVLEACDDAIKIKVSIQYSNRVLIESTVRKATEDDDD